MNRREKILLIIDQVKKYETDKLWFSKECLTQKYYKNYSNVNLNIILHDYGIY